MKITILKLVFRNFKSYIGEHRLSLEDRGVGLHFIRGANKNNKRLGSNGAGKSTIFDALCWCFYGRTVTGLKNPNVTPWSGEKGTEVSVLVQVGKKQHWVTRTIGPNRLRIDDDDCNTETVADFLGGIDFDLFSNTILLGQGRPLFFDLPPREKLELFANALGLGRWDERADKASKLAKDLQFEIAELQGQVMAIESSFANSDDLIQRMLDKRDEWEQDYEKRQKTAKKDLGKLEVSLEEKELQFGKVDLEYDGAETELRGCRMQLQKLNDELRQAEVTHATKDASCRQIQKEIRALDQQIEDLKADKRCPTCGQKVKVADLDGHREELKQKVRKLDERFDKADEVCRVAAEAIEKIQISIETIRKAEKEFQNKADNVESFRNRLASEVSALKSQVADAKKRNAASEGEVNPYVAQLRALKKTRADMQRQVDDLKKLKASRETRFESMRFWSKGFKEVRLYVLEEVLQELELVTNTILDEVGLSDWRVRYVVETETKSGGLSRGLAVLIESAESGKAAVRWENWSGGEGQRLRLIGALALSEVLLGYVGLTTQLEILDEPSQHLSVEGVRELCDYLAYRAETLGKQIFYVDHLAVESDKFRSVLSVVKSDTGSRFVV